MRVSSKIASLAAVLVAASVSTAFGQARPAGSAPAGAGSGGSAPATRPSTPAARPAAGAPQQNTGSQPAAPRSNPVAQASRVTPASGGAVAVIDITEVFRVHAKHQQAIAALNKSRKEIDTDKAAAAKTLQSKREELGKMQPGTPEFRAKEEEGAKMVSDANVEFRLKEKELLEREAQIFYTTYMDIQDAVRDFAQRNGISLVVRFSRAKVEVTSPDSVMQTVGRPIVFQDKLDITDEIISMVNPATASQSQRPAQPGRSVPK